MNQSELIQAAAESSGLHDRTIVRDVLQHILQSLMGGLISNGRVELRGFGVFEVHRRTGRKARNPRTGARIQVPPKYVVRFKPAAALSDCVSEAYETDAADLTE